MKSRGFGSLIKLRKLQARGYFRSHTDAVKFEKRSAHRATRRLAKRELSREDGWHTISCSPDDWNLY